MLLKRLRDTMARGVSAEETLGEVVRMVANEMVAEVCSIYLLRAGEVLELFATQGLNPSAVHRTRLRVGEGLVGDIAAHHRPLALADALTPDNSEAERLELIRIAQWADPSSALRYAALKPLADDAAGSHQDGGVVLRLELDLGTLDAVGVVVEAAARAPAVPRHAGRDRHAPALEESGLVHDDEQPLGFVLAVRAAEFGHVGVHREFLPGEHDVRIDDVRDHDRLAVEAPRGLGELLVGEQRLDPRDPFRPTARRRG